MQDVSDPDRALRRTTRVGGAVLLGTVGFFSTWAAATNLSGAVIASGSVVVESSVKKVQHPNGGIVGEIRIKEGEQVEAGALLIRLDETLTHASLSIADNQMIQVAARMARLEAEREQAAEIHFPSWLTARQDNPEIQKAMVAEHVLFESRREEIRNERKQLQERIEQLKEEIRGLKAQEDAKALQIRIIRNELAGVEELYAKNLVSLARVTALQRDAARLEGERGQFIAEMARSRGKIAEVEVQLVQLGQSMRSEVLKELREAQARFVEFSERKIAAEDQLRRIEIRAPQAGIVHQLTVHTVGGVIGAGETVMQIVPHADALIVEARVAPKDIDQVHLDEPATVRFTSFNQRTTPEFRGRVSRVGADLTQDPRSPEGHFVVRVALAEDEVEKLGPLKLVPGMPADVFIKTGERTAWSYLTKPLLDQIYRAFRED